MTEGAHLHKDWSFVGGSRVTVTPKLEISSLHRKSPGVYASCNLLCNFTLYASSFVYIICIVASQFEYRSILQSSKVGICKVKC